MNDRSLNTGSGYAILGCGSVGYAVAQDLYNKGKDVTILDSDESRVEALRDQDLNAIHMDITETEATEEIDDKSVVLILTSDVQTNKQALKNLRETKRDHYIVVRASDPVSHEELMENGADSVINPPQVIADSTIRSLESGELEYRAAKLRDVIESADEGVGVIIYNNPDPDSIASAMALEKIAMGVDIEADIVYYGEIGHQENRAFVNLLEIDLVEADEVDIESYSKLALVDHVEDFDEIGFTPNILIDHHSVHNDIEIEYMDVRPSIGSTSTILTKYLQEMEVDPTEKVTTGLLHGIRAETLDFRRNTSPADLTAAAYLHPFADHDLLEQVESPSMSPETLEVLGESIDNRETHGSNLISNVGFINDSSTLPPAAEHLLKLEGVTTTMVFGVCNGNIHIAARSNDVRINIARALKDAFGDRGEIAGHATQANARLSLGLFGGVDEDSNRETLLRLTDEAVTRNMLEAMGVEDEE